MKVLLIVLALSVTAAGQKLDGKKIEDWKEVSTAEGVHFQYSPESIRRSGDVIRVWTRSDFDNGSGELMSGTNFGSVRIFAVFDCANNQARGEDIFFYDRGARLVKAGRDKGFGEEKPGTFGYVIFEYLCERRAQFPTEPPKLKSKP